MVSRLGWLPIAQCAHTSTKGIQQQQLAAVRKHLWIFLQLDEERDKIQLEKMGAIQATYGETDREKQRETKRLNEYCIEW